MKPAMRLACLISGGGRTLINLCDAIDRGELNAEIPLVIASKKDLKGVERAQNRGLHVEVAPRSAFDSDDAMHDQITQWITDADIDLVCLCGWLRWVRLDDPLRNKVINIHPSLLPSFGGPGMYGMNVHRAVIEQQCSFSGYTVHLVDDVYDHGPVLIQRPCPVQPDDSPDDLAERVFEQECIAYPEAIRLFAADRVRIEHSRALLLP